MQPNDLNEFQYYILPNYFTSPGLLEELVDRCYFQGGYDSLGTAKLNQLKDHRHTTAVLYASELIDDNKYVKDSLLSLSEVSHIYLTSTNQFVISKEELKVILFKTDMMGITIAQAINQLRHKRG
jgi:hypothetical protein